MVPVARCSGSVDLWLSVSANIGVGPCAGSCEERDADDLVVRAEGGGVELGGRSVEAIPLPGDGGLAVNEGLDSDVGAAIAVTLVSTRGGSTIPSHSTVHTFHSGSMLFKACGIFSLGPPMDHMMKRES